MPENTDQKNFEYRHFLHSVRFATTKKRTQWKTHAQIQQVVRKLSCLISLLLTLNKYFLATSDHDKIDLMVTIVLKNRPANLLERDFNAGIFM